jgi:biotin carboxyl carrier protein
MNIEGLIEKAKGLGLTYLRVADAGEEIAIELRGSARATPAALPEAKPTADEREVVSVIVGYFRSVATPGSRVEQGAAIGIVESLGLPNDILAPCAGVLGEFAVSDGDAVEYGTVLARIKP